MENGQNFIEESLLRQLIKHLRACDTKPSNTDNWQKKWFDHRNLSEKAKTFKPNLNWNCSTEKKQKKHHFTFKQKSWRFVSAEEFWHDKNGKLIWKCNDHGYLNSMNGSDYHEKALRDAAERSLNRSTDCCSLCLIRILGVPSLPETKFSQYFPSSMTKASLCVWRPAHATGQITLSPVQVL